MLRNSSGLKQELFFSRDFHQEGIPLLVSPLLLRSRSLGQIDLSRIKKDQSGWILEIAEVKSSVTGEVQMERFQKARIYSAQKFLAALLGHRTRFLRLKG